MSNKKELKNNILLVNKPEDILWAIQNELDWADLRYVLELFNEERLSSIKMNLDDLRGSRNLGKG